MVATFDEFMPKTEKVLVGAEHVLDVCELVAAKRDQVFNIVFGDVNIIGALSAFSQLGDVETKDQAANDLAETAQKILGGAMTKIAQIVLSTPANMKKVGIEDASKFKNWVANNLTMKQEGKLLEQVLEVNDFVGLVKNYVALAGKVQPTGEADETEKEESAQTSA